MSPSFSEHGYPHASPPVTEPAQGSPRAIRGKLTTKFIPMPNHFANPPRNDALKMRKAVASKITAQTERLTREELQGQIRVRPCGSVGQWCLPESVRGEACSCQDSREGGVQTSVALASTVLLGHL